MLRRRAIPKRVQLPDGRLFYAKYEKIGRANLPSNINVRRAYTRTIGPRRHSRTRQRGRVIETVFKKAYYLSKKAVNSSLGKMLITEGLEYAPILYEKGTKKIKTKK